MYWPNLNVSSFLTFFPFPTFLIIIPLIFFSMLLMQNTVRNRYLKNLGVLSWTDFGFASLWHCNIKSGWYIISCSHSSIQQIHTQNVTFTVPKTGISWWINRLKIVLPLWEFKFYYKKQKTWGNKQNKCDLWSISMISRINSKIS